MSDFLEVMIMNATAEFNNLTTSNRYNSSLGKSEPCAPTDHGAAWDIVFSVTKEEDERLYGLGAKHFGSVKSRDTRLGEYSGFHSRREREDGVIQYTARRKCMTAKGKQNAMPPIVDAKRNTLEDRDFRGGSLINVKVSLLPTHSPASGLWGLSMFISAVQVITPIYAAGGVDDFPDMSGTVAATSNAHDFDDEIPFS